jgi:hypothetical protein
MAGTGDGRPGVGVAIVALILEWLSSEGDHDEVSSPRFAEHECDRFAACASSPGG